MKLRILDDGSEAHKVSEVCKKDLKGFLMERLGELDLWLEEECKFIMQRINGEVLINELRSLIMRIINKV